MKLVAGLGNPGRRYKNTRHNLGFRVVDALARGWGINVRCRRHRALVGRGHINKASVMLAKPHTWMNLSGEAVAPLARECDTLIVVHDDLDLSPGQLRVRQRGSAGGHQGVASVIQHLGSKEFIRVKIGIGRPPAGMQPADYVLQPLSGDELAVSAACQWAVEAIEALMTKEVDQVMAEFNARRPEGL